MHRTPRGAYRSRSMHPTPAKALIPGEDEASSRAKSKPHPERSRGARRAHSCLIPYRASPSHGSGSGLFLSVSVSLRSHETALRAAPASARRAGRCGSRSVRSERSHLPPFTGEVACGAGRRGEQCSKRAGGLPPPPCGHLPRRRGRIAERRRRSRAAKRRDAARAGLPPPARLLALSRTPT